MEVLFPSDRFRNLRIFLFFPLVTRLYAAYDEVFDPGKLARSLEGLMDEVLIDRMNYPNKVKSLYRKFGLDRYLEEDYFRIFGDELRDRFERLGVSVKMIF